jgi:hypothetical protein
MPVIHVPLARRYCTADSPMPHEDRDRYQWGHPDATEVMPFFNLVVYTCPHCKHTFHAEPRKPVP